VVAGAEGGGGLDLDGDAMRRHPRAVVRAVHHEASGAHRHEPDQAALDPVARRDPLDGDAAREGLAADMRHKIAEHRGVRPVAEMQIDLPAPVRAGERRAGEIGRVEAFRQQIGKPPRFALAGAQPRDISRRGFRGFGHSVLCTGRVCRSTGIIRKLSPDCPQTVPKTCPQVVTRFVQCLYSATRRLIGRRATPTSTGRSMDMTDKLACAELVQAWGFARDQQRWDDLLAIFHPEGEIAVSWFRGPYTEFVAHCRRISGHGSGQGPVSKHELWPARVTLNGERALAETSVAILVRQTIEGIAVDLTSYGRFLDRIEKRSGEWRMVERAALYEKDRLDPVEPSPAFAEMLAKADTAKFPAPYRYMAYRVEAAGRSLAEPVHYDGRLETEALKRRYAEWLKGR
jgi:hypothetical protein